MDADLPIGGAETLATTLAPNYRNNSFNGVNRTGIVGGLIR